MGSHGVPSLVQLSSAQLTRSIRDVLDLRSISPRARLSTKLYNDVHLRQDRATELALQPFMYLPDGTFHDLMGVFVYAEWQLMDDKYNFIKYAERSVSTKRKINTQINKIVGDHIETTGKVKDVEDLITPKFMTGDTARRANTRESIPLYMLVMDWHTGGRAALDALDATGKYEYDDWDERRRWLVEKLFREYRHGATPSPQKCHHTRK